MEMPEFWKSGLRSTEKARIIEMLPATAEAIHKAMRSQI
jgi:hypothetical protein